MDFSHIAERLSSPLTALPLMFLAGVLTSLTPCIYPMIPITAAIVGGATTGGTPSRLRALSLTLSYVLGLALVYSLLGLFAGLSGTIFGTVSANPWLYFLIANVLVLSALAMLDVLPVKIPARLLQFASTTGGGGSLSGAFIMGSLSGLVAAPCGAPVFASVLTWVSTTRSGTLGFLYLFVFSLGMCVILVVVGLGAGTVTRLPKAGVWMVWIKRIFAAAMIAVAEYYLLEAGKLWI